MLHVHKSDREREIDWLDSLLFEYGNFISLQKKTSLHESRIETEVNTVN